jgi:hypothetical protein
MTEAARADTGTAKRIRKDIKPDIVGTRSVTADASNSGQVVQLKILTHAPRDEMIGARGIATQSDSSEDLFSRPIERQTAAEYVDAANLPADRRVIGLT